MLDVSTEVKNLFMQNSKQYLRMRFPNNGATIELRETDVVQGSFRWDRYCTTGNMLEIGTAVAAEIEVTLLNTGSFKTTGGVSVPIENITFEGKELTVDIGVLSNGGTTISWMAIGVFMIMSMPHKFSTIHISALDRMTRLDMHSPVIDGENPFGSQETISSIISKICDTVGIIHDYDLDLPNIRMMVNIDKLYEDEPNVSYRDMIQWAAALTGTCAYMDYAGDLVLRWLETASGVTVTPAMRYSSSVYEPVTFGGLVAEKGEQRVEIGSDTYYRYTIKDNGFLQGDDWTTDYQSNLNDLWTALQATASPYRPFEANVVPMPYLEPMDVISYTDNNNTTFNTIITHITFTLNGGTSISGAGISETEAKCVPSGGESNPEATDIKYLKEKVSDLENSTIAARERLTGLMRMAMGLQEIPVTDPNGNTIYYFTSASFEDAEPTLETLGAHLKDNDVIYTFSDVGWVWCFGSDWDAAAMAPAISWRYGITKDGSAILGQINTSGINVSDEDSVYRTVITPDSFSVYRGATFVFGFNGQLESQINRLLVKSNIQDPSLENNAYIRIGDVMLVPADGGMNIVYVEDSDNI